MKPFLPTFLIVGLFAAAARAECVYFRVSTKLVKCGVADLKSLDAASPYEALSGTPELEDPASGHVLRASCECEYSLHGSDVRCELDQTVMKSSILGADETSDSCRRGNTLCRDVCPPQLP